MAEPGEGSDESARAARTDPARAETPLRVAADVFRRAPRAARLYFIFFTLYLVAVVAWGLATSKDALLHAPVYVAVFGGGGGMMLGLSVALFRVAQGERWRRRFKWSLEPKRMNEMLLALPLMTFSAGTMAAVASTLLVQGGRRNPWLWLVAALCLYCALASGKILHEGTRFLYFHAREQAAAAERARAEATDAQLAALQAQVNPHFLFNALNTIAALVRTEPRAAEATTENLAHVLRRTLDRTRRTECTLDDEVDFLRAWLAVERERFGERLRVDFEVEPAALPLKIPTMTLQPLVENSLKHGIAGKLRGGRVAVRARVAGERLVLEVEDDGAGFPREPREGTGLGNLRRRLETIYADAAELRVQRPPAGARVVVELPVDGQRRVRPAEAEGRKPAGGGGWFSCDD